MKIVHLNQKILESFNYTMSHNVLHNAVFKKGLALLEQSAHQFQQKP